MSSSWSLGSYVTHYMAVRMGLLSSCQCSIAMSNQPSVVPKNNGIKLGKYGSGYVDGRIELVHLSHDGWCTLTPPVVAIPFYILWKVKIRPIQKLGMSAFICLSICMVVAASIRLAGFRLAGDSIDLKWGYFWLHVEACIAVLAVSFTAFRSIFVQSRSATPEQGPKNSPARARLWNSRKPLSTNEVIMGDLPLIPQTATLMGMRTVIRGGPRTHFSEDDEKGPDRFELPRRLEPIKVTHEVFSRSEAVSQVLLQPTLLTSNSPSIPGIKTELHTLGGICIRRRQLNE